MKLKSRLQLMRSPTCRYMNNRSDLHLRITRAKTLTVWTQYLMLELCPFFMKFLLVNNSHRDNHNITYTICNQDDLDQSASIPNRDRLSVLQRRNSVESEV